MNNKLLRGVSVIICCYNSEWIIRRTLNALKAQQIPNGFLWEIVLVDNCCTDDTIEVAKQTMQDSAIDFIIIKENKAGLANARKCGISNVKYDIVVFCDDDTLLCPSYVQTVEYIMQSDPKIGAIGGKGIAEFQTTPDPIVEAHLFYYAVGSQMENDNFLFGAGLALRTALVRGVYNTQTCYLMGRKGKDLGSGDDSELVMSMVLRGYRVFPTDDISYTHVLKAERLTKDYYDKLVVGLLRPTPVFHVFRTVIEGKTFWEFLSIYIMHFKSLLWSYRHNKHSVARYVRKSCMIELGNFNYWGIIKLWRIFNSWKKINNGRIS